MLQQKLIFNALVVSFLIGIVLGALFTHYIPCKSRLWVSAESAGAQMCRIRGYGDWGTVGVTDNVIDNLYCAYKINGTNLNETGKIIIFMGTIV